MSVNFINDPVERAKRAAQKEEWVLYFLREEIYSTTSILAAVMCLPANPARKKLKSMEDKGYLVRDELRFMGMKTIPLWGITSTGVLEGLTPDEIAVANLRYHSVGHASALTIAHTLDAQKCRLYCEYELDFRGWTPERLLPGKGRFEKGGQRWAYYPDAVGDMINDKGLPRKVAIEIERTRKTPGRYVSIIRAHLLNIEKSRYARVWYFCQTQRDSDSLRALFVRLMTASNINFQIGNSKYRHEECINFFSFRSIEEFN